MITVVESFDNFMQQDAHEFLNYLLNTIAETVEGKYTLLYRPPVGCLSLSLFGGPAFMLTIDLVIFWDRLSPVAHDKSNCTSSFHTKAPPLTDIVL